MSKVGKTLFGGGQKTSSSSSSHSKTNQTQTLSPFSGDQLTNYNNFLNAAQNNYNNIGSSIGNITSQYSKGGIGDTSYFKRGWGLATGLDNSNTLKLNSQSFNPNDNSDWVAANDAIDSNARRNFGSTLNQVNQNIIGSGMANGSGHQTAAYKAATNLNSQLAADRANRWQTQYNQNMQNSLTANKQLQDFYNTLSSIGIDYAKLGQQDLQTLLAAYSAQNDALKTWGNAVGLGSNPTTTTKSETNTQGTNTQTNPSNGGLLGTAANLASIYYMGKFMGK